MAIERADPAIHAVATALFDRAVDSVPDARRRPLERRQATAPAGVLVVEPWLHPGVDTGHGPFGRGLVIGQGGPEAPSSQDASRA